MAQADIGLIGLAVMGENLILNMESKGFTVACFNRTVSKVDDFVNGRAKGKNIIGCHSIEELVASLKTPRKIMLMVKAGKPVDEFIEQLLPHLSNGDILIDGGNSNYQDTIRRTAYVESKGKLYIGTGVSGGEEGALLGPAIMPGGSPAAWEHVKPIFQKIAAKAPDGAPCCEWMGENGAGHFVKMVHNGIEYGDMQMICETYQHHEGRPGHDQRGDARGLRRVEPGGAGLVPDRDHRGHPGGQGPGGQARDRPDPRHRRPERHRQVDRDRGPGGGPAADADRRGGLRPLPVGPQGRASRRVQDAAQVPRARSAARRPTSSTTFARPCTPPRSSATPRASC